MLARLLEVRAPVLGIRRRRRHLELRCDALQLQLPLRGVHRALDGACVLDLLGGFRIRAQRQRRRRPSCASVAHLVVVALLVRRRLIAYAVLRAEGGV